MGKVKITQEQAEAIEDYKRFGSLEYFAISRHEFTYEYKSLKTLSIDEMARILYKPDGYEIEPEHPSFELHSYVTCEESNVWQVVKEDLYRVVLQGREAIKQVGYSSENFKKYTDSTTEEIAEFKEFRWWKSHNRDVWQLKENDVLSGKDVNRAYNVMHVDEYTASLQAPEADTSVNFSIDQIKTTFLVACFAQDRKDIKK